MNRRTLSVDKETEAVEQRPNRIPVGMRPKLAVIGKSPDFAYRFVNDYPGRIDMFKQGGWILCTNDEVDIGNNRAEDATAVGSLASIAVSASEGTRAYLMKIRKDWYDADMVAQSQHIDQLERDQIATNANDGEYGSVKIDRSGKR